MANGAVVMANAKHLFQGGDTTPALQYTVIQKGTHTLGGGITAKFLGG